MDGMNNNFENNNTTTNDAYQSMPNTTNYVAPQEPEKKTNGLAIAGMVLGIISIPAACCFACAGWICGILGLIFSILGQSKGKSGMGLAGIICSVIGLLFALTNSILGVVLNSTDLYNSIYNMF